MEQVKDEVGNQVLKALGAIIERENTNGSKSQQLWTDNGFHLFKFPDAFFTLPKHCTRQDKTYTFP